MIESNVRDYSGLLMKIGLRCNASQDIANNPQTSFAMFAVSGEFKGTFFLITYNIMLCHLHYYFEKLKIFDRIFSLFKNFKCELLAKKDSFYGQNAHFL